MIYQAEDFQDCVHIRKSKKMNHPPLLTDEIFLANKKSKNVGFNKAKFSLYSNYSHISVFLSTKIHLRNGNMKRVAMPQTNGLICMAITKYNRT